MKHAIRYIAASLCAVMVASLAGCSAPSISEGEKFDEWGKNLLINEMQADYTGVHTYFEHPENFGIDMDQVEVTIGESIALEYDASQREEILKTKQSLEEIDREQLSDQQKAAYDYFLHTLEINSELAQEKFQFYGSLFESTSGLHNNLASLFSDYTLRNEQDAEDMVTLLESVYPYVESAVAYTNRQQEEGTLSVDIETISAYCTDVIETGEESEVLSNMIEEIEGLALDEAKEQDLIARTREAFSSSYLQAYQAILDCMQGLDPQKNHTEGLAALPDGREYYALLFDSTLGSGHTIDETRRMLNSLMEESFQTMVAVAMEDPELYDAWANGAYTTGYSDFESMLEDLLRDIEGDFPSVGEFDYDIGPIPEEIATGGVAAYFQLPAVDSEEEKIIRVNMMEGVLDIGSMETYSTIAHEGIPGHMYQVEYSYQDLAQAYQKILVGPLGYTEGYAKYVELYALKYLDVAPAVIELEQAYNVFLNCFIALSDIGIHYDGWSLQDFQDYAESLGLMGDLQTQYDQLVYSPGVFLSYFVGYAEIADMRAQAESELGDAFSDLAFHTVLLKNGSRLLSTVREDVEVYIAQTKAQAQSAA